MILQKQVLGGKLTLEGYLRVSVLYQGEEDQSLCQVEQKLPFSKSVELKNGGYSSYRVSVHGESEYLNTRAINSRRIDVKGAYAFAVVASGQMEQEMVTALSGRRGAAEAGAGGFHPGGGGYRESFFGGGRLQLPHPAGGGALHQLHGSISEIKLISGKAVVKGTVRAVVTYRSAPGYALEQAEKELPFNQIVDIENLTEDCECHVQIVPRLHTGGGRRGGRGQHQSALSANLSLLVAAAEPCLRCGRRLFDAVRGGGDHQAADCRAPFGQFSQHGHGQQRRGSAG